MSILSLILTFLILSPLTLSTSPMIKITFSKRMKSLITWKLASTPTKLLGVRGVRCPISDLARKIMIIGDNPKDKNRCVIETNSPKLVF